MTQAGVKSRMIHLSFEEAVHALCGPVIKVVIIREGNHKDITISDEQGQSVICEVEGDELRGFVYSLHRVKGMGL